MLRLLVPVSVGAVVALALVAHSTDFDTATAAPSPAERQPPDLGRKLVREKPLPDMARKLLEERMTRHRQDMEALLWTAIMLDYAGTEQIAQRIASTPQVPRPRGAQKNALHELLPEQFYVMQDQLRQRAVELSKAAADEDDAAIARSYGRLTETCVACHAVYLGIELP